MLNAILNLLSQHNLMSNALFVFLYVYRDSFAWHYFLIYTPSERGMGQLHLWYSSTSDWGRVSMLSMEDCLQLILFLYWKNPFRQDLSLSCKSSIVTNDCHNFFVCGIVVPFSLHASVRNQILNLIYLIAFSSLYFFFNVDTMINCVQLNRSFHSLKIR